MLSDEEKQAIEGLKGSQKWIRQQIRLGNLPDYNQGHYVDIEIVLNLIEKQSKEIEELKEKSNHITKETVEFVNSHYIHKGEIKAKIEDILNSENSEAIEKLIEWQSLLEKE